MNADERRYRETDPPCVPQALVSVSVEEPPEPRYADPPVSAPAFTPRVIVEP
jgi:hypothetical protein